MAATAQSVCDWLQQQHHVDTSTTAATADTATASAAEAQRVATAMLTGATDTLDGVIRDCVYVQCTGDDDSNDTTTTPQPHRRSPVTHYTHAVLTAIAAAAAATAAATSTDAGSKARRGKSDATATTARTSATYKHALLRYAALAHSLHPYTVFALLREAVGSKRRNDKDDSDKSSNSNNSNSSSSSHCSCDNDDDDGLMLALAALLVRKVELQAGGLRRLPHFVAVVHTLFAAPATSTTTTTTNADVVVQHRFVAALCRTACSAVAVGSLDAACLLAVLADAAVTCVYALDTTTTTTTTTTTAERNGSVNDTHDEATIAACTRDIAAALTFLSSYVQWSLHGAAPALGVLSAHVGRAYAQTKEAAVRDGASHPIALSRPVDIAPLSVARTRAPAQL